MRKGKMIAQGAHASLGAILDNGKLKDDKRVQAWLAGPFKKIAVYVNSEQEMLDIKRVAEDNNLITCLIVDNGLTEFGGVKTITALAVGPDIEDNINVVTGHLPLL
jgi:PTH2 family peptidyl-tRNA hydrolase